jgi:moderate conductance mechanosensitive channel
MIGSLSFLAKQGDSSMLDWARTDGLRIALVIALALVVSKVAGVAIRRMRRRMEGQMDATQGLNLQRTATIAQIMTSAVRVAVWTVAALVVLGQLGVDLGPLIAGAGLVGVALGFGAQSLVRDWVAGFFVLFENQYGVGDIIEMRLVNETVTGRVEAMSLRATWLRTEDGTLAVAPNGNIQFIENRSRGQARVIVDVSVPREEDLDEIRGLLEDLCEDLRSDPRLSQRLYDGPNVVGVDRLAGDSVLLRVEAQTRPSRAEEVRRTLTRQISEKFLPVGHRVDVAPEG